jgi:hypothetical protein
MFLIKVGEIFVPLVVLIWQVMGEEIMSLMSGPDSPGAKRKNSDLKERA